MKPRQFEEYVRDIYAKQDYKVELTSYSGDYGVDVFAHKNNEKIAIQVKMYGNGRKINRNMIMELYGASHYFDCTRAVIATDGAILPDAIKVAEKLNIEILNIQIPRFCDDKIDKSLSPDFLDIWEKYIIPLQGKTLESQRGKTNTILKVDWTGVERITSKNKIQKIEIEIFKFTIRKLLSEGFITRDEINQNYVGRASSGIVLILSQVPFFTIMEKPAGLKLKITES